MIGEAGNVWVRLSFFWDPKIGVLGIFLGDHIGFRYTATKRGRGVPAENQTHGRPGRLRPERVAKIFMESNHLKDAEREKREKRER